MHEIQTNEYPGVNVTGVLVGMLLGGLIGAVTMLLLAPQSGADTRKQLQRNGIELRDRTNEIVEEALAQVGTSTQKIKMRIKDPGKL